MAANKPKKKQALRNNEYYSTQTLFDDLYERSQRGESFTHLMELIASEQNILLAYRAIKKNKGSKTKGVNSTTIVEMGEKQPEELIAYVRKRLENFHPHPVRRVEIPKPDGRTGQAFIMCPVQNAESAHPRRGCTGKRGAAGRYSQPAACPMWY